MYARAHLLPPRTPRRARRRGCRAHAPSGARRTQRLTIGVDSPEERELREDLDEEDPKSVSPDELVVAFMEIMDGAPISDELALRVLSQTMREWPEPDAGAAAADDGEDGEDAGPGADPGKKLKDSVVGWIPLYAVSAVPVIIGVSVVGILFANSLK